MMMMDDDDDDDDDGGGDGWWAFVRPTGEIASPTTGDAVIAGGCDADNYAANDC